MTSKIISQKRLKELLHYNPDTGIFIWRKRQLSDFKTARAFGIWGARRAGKEAGSIDHYGYRIIKINGKQHKAHRLAWLYVHGEFPESEIDHFNQDRGGNRISNLMSATRSENMRNVRLRITNTTGVTGISWSGEGQKWVVQISRAGAGRHLGYFNDFFEAVCCRKSAQNKYGYFENHGRKV